MIFGSWNAYYETPRAKRVELVASAGFAVVDFDRLGLASEDPFSYADWYSQELGHAMEMLVDSGCPRERTLKLSRGGWPIAVLFMEDVHVVRRYRGHSLGRFIAAEGIATLGRGCGFVLTFPSPTEKAAPPGSDEHKQQQIALRRYWTKIGFRSFAHGYSALDLYGRNRQLDRHLLRWHHLPSKDYYD